MLEPAEPNLLPRRRATSGRNLDSFSPSGEAVAGSAKACFQSSACTSAGTRRRNQDRYHVDDQLGLYLVVDGMAGHNGGMAAALLAEQVLVRCFSELLRNCIDLNESLLDTCLTSSIESVQKSIRIMENSSEYFRGMGCTFAIVILRENRAWWCHVGNTRVYRLDSGLELLTEDETVSHELVAQGFLDAANENATPWRNYLTNSLTGRGTKISPKWNSQPLGNSEFVLATNGLNEGLADQAIETILHESEFVSAALRLVKHSVEHSAHNTTCIVCASGLPRKPENNQAKGRQEKTQPMPRASV